MHKQIPKLAWIAYPTTTSRVKVVISAENKPENLPSFEEIIKQCFVQGPLQSTAINISGVRLTPSLVKRSNNDNDATYVWVKYGQTIRMGEAKTQNFVAQHLANTADAAVRAPQVYLAFTWDFFGYIVMEYIDGQMCGNADVPRVAAAIQSLIAIPSPASTPGPVGGGVFEHPFFVERTSSIWYESAQELEDHINGVVFRTLVSRRPFAPSLLSVTQTQILAATRPDLRLHVSFGPELATHGLRLCPSDLKCVNFMKDSSASASSDNNSIVAIDFGGYSFLPPSFAFALQHSAYYSGFAARIANVLVYSPSTELEAMWNASYGLVPFQTNDIGLSKKLKSRLQ
ncbi:hypothetical protein B0H12DRAFT_1326784 [Mycena haematopus]|nr:hypothetical protein B0H12DRAFT_1326784 [Mycena haematopus]